MCSHLASGEKEGDELKRNADVIEILKSAQFPKVCKNPYRRPCERITDHEYVHITLYEDGCRIIDVVLLFFFVQYKFSKSYYLHSKKI